MNIHRIVCSLCGKEIVFTDGKYASQRRRQKYCSWRCRQNAYSRRKYVPSESRNLATGVVGAANELRVSVDLMRKGYEVFRALAPACSCDLVALKDGKLTRVEVRTGHKRNAKGYTFFKDSVRADLLAIVLPDEIVYHFSN